VQQTQTYKLTLKGHLITFLEKIGCKDAAAGTSLLTSSPRIRLSRKNLPHRKAKKGDKSRAGRLN
jgi:hypothetical protein